MIGFILTKTQADRVEKAIKDNFAKQGLPFFWSPGFYLIETGADAGKYFMPMSSDITNANLYRGLKFSDFSGNQKEIAELKKVLTEKDFPTSDLRASKAEVR